MSPALQPNSERFQQGSRTVPLFRGVHVGVASPRPQRLKPNRIDVGNSSMIPHCFFTLRCFLVKSPCCCISSTPDQQATRAILPLKLQCLFISTILTFQPLPNSTASVPCQPCPVTLVFCCCFFSSSASADAFSFFNRSTWQTR